MRVAPLVFLAIAGCAVAPKHNEAELAEISQHTEAMCWMIAVPRIRENYPADFAHISKELARRGVTCTPALTEEGRTMFVRYNQRRLAEQQQAQAERNRQAAAVGSFVGRVLEAVVIGAAAGAAIQATTPPTRPINCTTTYNGNTAQTFCYP